MAQDRDRLWDLVNAVMKTFRFHKIQGILCLAEKLLATQEELYSTELVV